MNIEALSDGRIIEAWTRNASPWTNAVRAREIESRRLVTDRAILDAVLAAGPRTVLDLGCGEGWLALALQRNGIEVTAVDVVPALILAAKEAGVIDSRVLSYEEIAEGRLRLGVDVVVCNFSLLGKESVDGLLRAVPTLLKPDGILIVQTLHPLVSCGDLPYEDGWRPGSWAGFSTDFNDAPPWYFRTLQTWLEVIRTGGLTLCELQEPIDPRTGKPASVIFCAGAVSTPIQADQASRP
jgi:2-polyprenyl-3-methyl-5-hydroxy-6-metoxy-1,4-benzoquinol methylase